MAVEFWAEWETVTEGTWMWRFEEQSNSNCLKLKEKKSIRLTGNLISTG